MKTKKEPSEVLYTLILRKGECAWAFVEEGRVGLFGDLNCSKARVLFSLMVRGTRDPSWLQEHLAWVDERSDELWGEMRGMALFQSSPKPVVAKA